MALPEVNKIRGCIEQVKREDIRLILMAEYLFAGRSREIVGKVSSTDSNSDLVYGPKGKDVEIKRYTQRIPETLKALQIMQPELEQRIKALYEPLDVAVFSVKIAKRRLEQGEQMHVRKIALPLDSDFEPWTQELLDCYKDAGSDYVFPLTRQAVWNWISYKEPVFKGLTYPITKYRWKPRDQEVFEVSLPHNKPFKQHALRHLRVTELRRDYGFDGLQLAAYAGWSMTHASAQTRTNERYSQQTTTYFPLYEEWEAYFPKLLVKRNEV